MGKSGESGRRLAGDRREARRKALLHDGMIRSTPDAYVALDEAGRVVEWSPQAERMLGWPTGDALGRNFASLMLAPLHGTAFLADLTAFRRTGRSPLLEKPARMTLLRSGEASFPAELCLAAVDLDGEWLFTGFVRDLSEAALAEQQLVQAQKMEAIGQLTGGLAHDFSNMLGIIIGSLDIAAKSPEDAARYLETARVTARQAAGVVRSLMAVARRRPLNPTDVDLNRAILELEPLIRQTAGQQVNVAISAEASASRAHIDASGFSNAIVNLVINARDAMPGGGRLLVYSYTLQVRDELSMLGLDLRPGPYVVVGVDDSGQGMTAAVVARAFEPFYTTKAVGKGTGLGLSAVYGFCRQSGGIARIESKAGEGCSVQLLLPVADPAGLATASPPGQIRILLVDRDSPALRPVRDWLTAAGHEVRTAASGGRALSMLAGQPCDLLVMAILEPEDGDDFEIGRHARLICPRIGVLFLAGAVDPAGPSADGPLPLVLKLPVDRQSLTSAVQRSIAAPS